MGETVKKIQTSSYKMYRSCNVKLTLHICGIGNCRSEGPTVLGHLIYLCVYLAVLGLVVACKI